MPFYLDQLESYSFVVCVHVEAGEVQDCGVVVAVGGVEVVVAYDDEMDHEILKTSSFSNYYSSLLR